MHIVQAFKDQHPDFAYLHLVEPETIGTRNRDAVDMRSEVRESNDLLREIWTPPQPRPLILAGGFTRKLALQYADRGDLIALGRLFISNVSLYYMTP